MSVPPHELAVPEALGDAVDLSLRGCRARPPSEREVIAARLYERLHPAMAVLAVLFLVVVLAQRAALDGSAVQRTLTAATWLLWLVFVGEYVLRAVIAPDTRRFLSHTWWQIGFLLVPVLSLARSLLILRVGRPARVALAAFRSTRSTRARLSSRIGWIALVTAMVVFAVADVLYGTVGIHPYGRALHAAAQASITGEPLPSDRGLAQVLDIVLDVYAIAVFAAVAGALGAYFLERPHEQRAADPL